MFKKYYYEGQETDYSVSEEGKVRNDKTGKELKGTIHSNEYQRVILTINGKFKSILVHRMVAETFLPNPDNLPVVHHKDRNKINNHLDNLQWVTFSENFEGGPNKREPVYAEIDENDDNWKDIPGFDGYKASKMGQIYNKNTRRILSGSYRNEYLRVNIKGKNYSAHVLVYSAFFGEVPKGMVIDHINGKKDDNRIENLRCVSQSENMYNAQRNGHKGQCKVAQYDLDHNFIKEYSSCSEAAKEFGVTYAAISSAANRGGTSCGYYWKKL